MLKASNFSGLERVISFGGICTIIGMVGDLLTPVGNYTLISLGLGIIVTVGGLIALSARGFSSELTKASLSFGVLLTLISVFFLIYSPDDRGLIASEVHWVADAQKEILGLSEEVRRISENTQTIVDSSKAIEEHTNVARNLSFSSEGFVSALRSGDSANIEMYCSRGYRVEHIAYLLLNRTDAPNLSDRNFSQLQSLRCFDETVMCNPENWRAQWMDLADRLDPERVGSLCGATGSQELEARRVTLIRQREEAQAQREAKFEVCVQDNMAVTGDDGFARSMCRHHLQTMF